MSHACGLVNGTDCGTYNLTQLMSSSVVTELLSQPSVQSTELLRRVSGSTPARARELSATPSRIVYESRQDVVYLVTGNLTNK